jgi:hypothetical protein
MQPDLVGMFEEWGETYDPAEIFDKIHVGAAGGDLTINEWNTAITDMNLDTVMGGPNYYAWSTDGNELEFYKSVFVKLSGGDEQKCTKDNFVINWYMRNNELSGISTFDLVKVFEKRHSMDYAKKVISEKKTYMAVPRQVENDLPSH